MIGAVATAVDLFRVNDVSWTRLTTCPGEQARHQSCSEEQ
jgi:hypothetical protein